MKTIAQKFWTEPAVVIGLLVSIGLLIANLIGDPDWSAQSIIAIIAPFATSLGVRSIVYAPATVEALTAPVPTLGTTYAPAPLREP